MHTDKGTLTECQRFGVYIAQWYFEDWAVSTLWPHATRGFAVKEAGKFASMFQVTDVCLIDLHNHFGMCSGFR